MGLVHLLHEEQTAHQVDFLRRHVLAVTIMDGQVYVRKSRIQ